MDFTITSDEQKILLADARESIASQLEGRPPRYLANENSQEQSVLQKPCGAFVTLHKNEGGGRRLRGCIGRMTDDFQARPQAHPLVHISLLETIRVMAKEAAFGDPRFPPLQQNELEHCRIEISVLSPLSVCSDPRQVKVGVHGLYLTRGGRSGVLLPQVPTEQGWDLDEYLDYICIKARLPRESYNAEDATLYTFTAVVFGE